MKNLKKIFYWAIILISAFFCSNVKALDGEYEIKITVERLGQVDSNLLVDIIGDFNDDYKYYVKFVNEGDPKPTLQSKYDIEASNSDITKYKEIYKNEDKKSGWISIFSDWYMLKGYDYVYLIKCGEENCEISENPVKLTRDSLPSIGSRYKIYLFDNVQRDISVFPLFPHRGSNGSHKLIVKIGQINNNNLLYSVYKKEAGALENLINYAKNDSGKTLTFDDTNNTYNPIGDINVINGAYYYIYTNYENENGLYRELGDITVAMGKNDSLINDVEWNFGETGNTDVVVPETPTSSSTTTQAKAENPKTADLNTNIIVTIFIGCIGLIVISKKKLRKN